MAQSRPAARYRFGVFELDSSAGELRRSGLRVKLHTQPLQMLRMLVERPGEILSREEICRELWPEGTFVDYEHGVNSAVNRLREALGDKASTPRFIETVARRGYRFVTPVERVLPPEQQISVAPSRTAEEARSDSIEAQRAVLDRVLAAPEDLPKSSRSVVQILFLLLQGMYGAFYIAALVNFVSLREFFSGMPFGTQVFTTSMATAALLIPVRTYLICAALFHAPSMRDRFLRIWPFLLVADGLWSLAPFLLRNINEGLALACTTLLVYSPFAQRSLILMGAGQAKPVAAD